jgi:glucose-6-phosphate 1-epimerase
MEVFELWSGDTKALISLDGGWLTNLSDQSGDILFPKRLLTDAAGDKKIRGGCHVCLPNFGPGGSTGQSQHGFGRTMPWFVLDQQPSRLELELSQGKDEYGALTSIVVYELEARSMKISLKLSNGSSNTLRVAPGLHPYFALSRGEETASVNGVSYATADLLETKFFENSSNMTLQTQRRTVTLQSENLSTWALWTDQLGEYVCVEPTFGGYAFLEQATDNQQLRTAEAQMYSLTISW